MQYGCIGERLKHSFSPEIHARLGNYRYELCEIEPHNLERFLLEKNFLGINVTIPYKEAVIPYLSEIDAHAKEIGAVNTIVNRNGRLCGYNTDFYGMKAMIERMGLSLCQKKVAVLGTGGTSRTARAVAAAMGAGEILAVSRRAGEGVVSYEQLYADHADVQIFINTTPCGMFPHPDSVAVDLTRFPRLEGVADAVFNPLRPQLVTNAKGLAIPAEGGLFMLVAQAVRASEIFFDCTYPAEIAERIYQKLSRKKENIVLVGMPASGKSTVGRLLAERLGREFYDSDELVVKTAGKSIPDIFREDGEAAFRDLESCVISEQLAQKNGLVIATGGGAILRDGNVNVLRRNGRIYFLDRPLEDLLPTEDRPLASTAEKIRLLYEERYFRYCNACDVRIDVRDDAKKIAEQIGKDYET